MANSSTAVIAPAGEVTIDSSTRFQYTAHCDTTGALITFPVFSRPAKWRVQIKSTAQAGTTPTLDCKMQDSLDGVNWNDLASFTFTQFTGAGVPHVDAPVEFSGLHGPYVRLFGTIGGSASPSIDIQLDAITDMVA